MPLQDIKSSKNIFQEFKTIAQCGISFNNPVFPVIHHKRSFDKDYVISKKTQTILISVYSVESLILRKFFFDPIVIIWI